MKIVVGLGNLGKEYENNRHNVGFIVLDKMISADYGLISARGECSSKGQCEICDFQVVNSEKIIFAKPTTYMNSSGLAVSSLVEFYKISPDNLLVIHDDLDLKLGEYKLQKGIGPKLHNGLLSIENSLGTKDFWRLRVGVDNRLTGEKRITGEDYVLRDFTSEERLVLDKLIGDKLSAEI